MSQCMWYWTGILLLGVHWHLGHMSSSIWTSLYVPWQSTMHVTASGQDSIGDLDSTLLGNGVGNTKPELPGFKDGTCKSVNEKYPVYKYSAITLRVTRP